MNFRLHIPSLFAGLGLALLLGASSLPPYFRVGLQTLGEVPTMPRARDMVEIVGGMPYTVPQGKFFVLTNLGRTDGGSSATLTADGVPVATGNITNEVPLGHAFPAGRVLDTGSSDVLRAWGYLENE